MNLLAVVVDLASAERDHGAFHGLFLSGIRNDDAALFDFFFFHGLDQNAVAEGLNVQCHSVFFSLMYTVIRMNPAALAAGKVESYALRTRFAQAESGK